MEYNELKVITISRTSRAAKQFIYLNCKPADQTEPGVRYLSTRRNWFKGEDLKHIRVPDAPTECAEELWKIKILAYKADFIGFA